MILVFLLYALFASVFTVAKTALSCSSPMFLVGGRMVAAGLLMLIYQSIRNRKELVLRRNDWWKVALLGLVNIYLTNILELWGLKYLTSFKTCFLYSLSPFLSILFSYLLLQEKMTRTKWLGFVVGFIGFLPVLIHQDGASELLTGSFWFFSWPELSVLGAVVASVIGWILLKQLVDTSGCSTIVVNGFSMCFGGIFALFQSLVSEGWDPLPVTDWRLFLECTLFLIIVSNIICYNLYGMLLKTFSATFMSFAGLSTPIFTALFGWFFHNEMVTMDFFIALAVVSIGLFLVYLEELKEQARERRLQKAAHFLVEEMTLP